MVEKSQIQVSKAIQRHTGRTFHVATRLLPARVRRATYVLYAFFRIADEVVDDPDPGPTADQRTELERIRDGALGRADPDDPVVEAFRDLKEQYDIPDREVEEFIDAMLMDVTRDRYATYEDLEGYLRGSSVAVAYMMLAIMDPADAEAARPHAKALGEAFQLTNFLRDVREDVLEYGRIYLPQRTLAAYGVRETEIERLRFSDGFAAVMRSELRRTERLYREGVAGIRHLPEDCQFGVLLAAVLYAEHHRLIRGRGLDVLAERPTLGAARRLQLAARTWYHWKRRGDPEAVFYRVSAVPESEASAGTVVAGSGGSVARITARSAHAVTRPARHAVGALRSWLPTGFSN